jgi:hypothetical protein
MATVRRIFFLKASRASSIILKCREAFPKEQVSAEPSKTSFQRDKGSGVFPSGAQEKHGIAIGPSVILWPAYTTVQKTDNYNVFPFSCHTS